MGSRSLRVLQVGEIFEIRYVGEVSYAYRTQTWAEVAHRLRDSDIKKLLIDFSSAWPIDEPDPSAARDFIGMVVDFVHARGWRVALLGTSDQHARAVESAASIAGFGLARFDDRDAALAWLSQ